MAINVSNLPTSIIKDADGRYILDSYSKVLDYILCTSDKDTINLSNCIIMPSSGQITFDIHELYNYAKKRGQNLKIGITKKRKSHNQIIISKRFICNNCIIKKAFFSNSTFEKFVSFTNSDLKDLHFTHSIFSESLDITKTTITGYLACNGLHATKVYLHFITYEGSTLDFSCSKIQSISILSSTFNYSKEDKKEAIEKPGLLHTDFNFALSLLGDVFLSHISSELFITFLDSHITGRFRGYNCNLDKGLIFEGCTISGKQSLIHSDNFHEVRKDSTLNLEGCKIQSELTIIGVSYDVIYAQDSTIESSGRLSLFQIATNHIDFERVSIYGELNINHINPKSSKNAYSVCEINMECAINLGSINITLENIKLLNYDTAKIIRLAAQKLNNSIEVTALKAIEHKLFLKENKLQWKYTSVADHLLLWLNKVSNNFGTNWLTGCLFCVTVSILSVCLINYSIGEYVPCLIPSDWVLFSKEFWIKTLEFLWLPDLESFKDLISSEGCSPWTIIIYIIGKSLIAYGIFQTVAAFRKYSSK